MKEGIIQKAEKIAYNKGFKEGKKTSKLPLKN